MPPLPDSVREALLAACSAFLEKCEWINDAAFVPLFSCFLRLFDLDQQLPAVEPDALLPPTTDQRVASRLSEETHLHLARCFQFMFAHYDPRSPGESGTREGRIAARFAEQDLEHSLGFAVYRLLELSSVSKWKSVPIEYLRALSSISAALAKSTFLPSILPGMLMACSRILGGDFKRGSVVFEETLSLLSTCVVTSMADAKNPAFQGEPSCTTELPVKIPEAISILRSFTETKESDVVEPSTDPRFPAAAWFSTASARVEPLLRRIFRIANRGSSIDDFEESVPLSASSIAYEQPTVRVAVVTAAAAICVACSRTLSRLLPLLLDVLVSFLFDEMPVVCKAAEKALTQIASLLRTSRGGASLATSCLQNLERLLLSLPRVIRMTDEHSKLSRLRALLGYLFVLRDSLPKILPEISSRLSECLVDCLEINLKDPSLSQPRGTRGVPQLEGIPLQAEPPSRALPALRFLHFQNPAITRLFIAVIHFLGRYSNLLQLADPFVALIRDASSQTPALPPPQAIFLLNELLWGAVDRSAPADSMSADEQLPERPVGELEDITDAILAHYLSSDLWNPQFGGSRNLVSSSSVASRVVQSVLLLDGLGIVALALGPRIKFKLMDLLYPLLEKLGDDIDIVSQAAWAALLPVALSSQKDSVLDLIRDNSDYVVDSVLQNLRYLQDYTGAIRVLHGVLKHAGELLIPLLADILDEVFRCLDDRKFEHTLGYLGIMHSAAALVRRTLSTRALSGAPNAAERSSEPRIFEPVDLEGARLVLDDKNLPLGQFLRAKLCAQKEQRARSNLLRQEMAQTRAEDFFKQYHADKAEKGLLEEPDAPLEDEETPPAETDDPLSKRPGESDEKFATRITYASQLAVVARILDKCQHYASVRSIDQVLLVLEIISQSILALECDQNLLLPIVHKVWEPLTWRFTDPDPRVCGRALGVMQILANQCGEFVTRKFLDDLWPSLQQKLARFDPYTKIGQQFAVAHPEDSQHSSLYERSPELFKFTASYRLQRAQLECVATAVRHMKIGASPAMDILQSTWFYVSSNDCLPELSSLAMSIVETLLELHGDATWRFLADLGLIVASAPSESCFHVAGQERRFRIISAAATRVEGPRISLDVGQMCRNVLQAPDGMLKSGLRLS